MITETPRLNRRRRRIFGGISARRAEKTIAAAGDNRNVTTTYHQIDFINVKST